MKPTRNLYLAAFVLAGVLLPISLSAQVTNVVFSEDFSGPLNTNKLIVGTKSLEGGTGTITPTVSGGVVEFTGTVTEQWWAGGSLQVAPQFPVNVETNAMVSVDRVLENGSGSAHRSALWVLDPTLNYFVLFAEDVGETEWEYNRKIGIPATDSATGSGNAISAFDASGSPFLDDGLHNMAAVANGQTVKLYLDQTFGVEVPFPFSPVVFAIGSLARANNDIADTVFDNLQVATIGLVAFSPDSLLMVSGQTLSNVVVRIPAGANATKPVHVTVSSDTPTIAVPAGTANGTLSLTFAAGATNVQPLTVSSPGPSGGAVLSLTNDAGIGSANSLSIVVAPKAGVVLTDDFSGATLDSSKWQVNTNGFEVGQSDNFTVSQSGGQLTISGDTDLQQYWAGASLVTQSNYVATPQLALSFEADRLFISTNSTGGTGDTAARTGIFISQGVRQANGAGGPYVFFGQDAGETGWEVNVNPGNPTGSGTALSQFTSLTDTNAHHLQLIADGSQVEVFLDGKSGGKFPFKVSEDIHFEMGAYARALGDSVVGVFDNAKIQYILPPISVASTSTSQAQSSIETTVGVNTNTFAVTVPQLISTPLTVTISSQNPQVAIPAGGSNGTLALHFAPGAPNTQTFAVSGVGAGATSFSITNDQTLAVSTPQVNVSVVNPVAPVFTDTFSSATVDTNKNWLFETTALDSATPGGITSDSALVITNGTLEMAITADTGNWPGMDLRTRQSYPVSPTSPVDFEVDRTKLGYTLVTGTGALERSGVWVWDANSTNYLFFDEYVVHNSGTAGGWQYNVVTGQSTDSPLPGAGPVIQPFTAPALNDQGNHHLKVEANGTDVKLYLDGIYGATVPFPATNVTFGIGTYVAAATDIVDGFFDNAVVSSATGTGPTLGSLSAVEQAGKVVVNWTGAGTLQSAATITGPWTDVSPAPSGNSLTVTASSQKQQFYRLRQ